LVAGAGQKTRTGFMKQRFRKWQYERQELRFSDLQKNDAMRGVSWQSRASECRIGFGKFGFVITAITTLQTSCGNTLMRIANGGKTNKEKNLRGRVKPLKIR
jgi:hypothetical protein